MRSRILNDGKFVIVVLLLLFIPIKQIGVCKAQGAENDRIVTTYYISSTLGDDNNDGLTIKTPKKHLSAIVKRDNVCVRLKRDDVFFEQLQGFSSSVIESYGSGAKPVLCGFKVLITPGDWIYDDANCCWRIDLKKTDSFSGILKGDIQDKYFNNIGFLYDASKDKVYGHRVRTIGDLKEESDFFISSHFCNDSISDDTFRYLWWKTNKKPNNCGRLCFSTPLVGVRRMFSCTIRDISVVGFCFGFTNCHHSVIENCQIDLIGGSVQIGYPNWVRYGNGIEFWGNTKNAIVRNCLISRTYDCGTTIQGGGEFITSPENIHITNNRFYHCRQAFEFWLNPSNDYKAGFINCSFTGNVCYYMGENEFSSPENRDANLLCYDRYPKPIVIEYNTFWGASHFCGSHFPDGMRNNQVYINDGQYLSYYNAKYKPVYVKSQSDIEIYRMQSGDNSSIYVLSHKQKKKIEKILRKKVGWKRISLHLERL